MTCREKLQMEHPECMNENCMGGCRDCPNTYGYMDNPVWCDSEEEICAECWNREIPGTEPTTSAVNHPTHYNREGGMECIDEMVLIFGKEAVMYFCLCNAWKYRYRAADKNGVEDLKKSDWYLAKYKELKGDVS